MSVTPKEKLLTATPLSVIAPTITRTVTAPRVSEMSYVSMGAAPRNLPVGDMVTLGAPHGYEAYYESDIAPVSQESMHEPLQGGFEIPHTDEVVQFDSLEARAHDAQVLVSTDAIRFIMAQEQGESERVTLLDHVVNLAKGQFPTEDGWVVVNKDRMISLMK